MWFIRAFLIAAACIGVAHAADLQVHVVDASNRPVEYAVVTFNPAQRVTAPIKFPWPYRVAQHNIQFEPRLLIVPIGATVSFPNLDNVRHHVYSFASGNSFELKLYGRDETRTHVFTAPGVVAIGCNIHDQMSAYIVVVDTPFAAQTDANGEVTFRGVSGQGEIRVWHSLARARGGIVSKAVTLQANTAAHEDLQIELRAAAPMNMK